MKAAKEDHHLLDPFKDDIIEVSLTLDGRIWGFKGKHQDIMLILTLELEVKIIVGLSSFVLSLNPTFRELELSTLRPN